MKRHYLAILFSLFTLALSAQIQPVVISEVFYDTPLEEDMLKSPHNHHNGEFVELYNPTNEDIDISGWHIRDDYVGYTFPKNTVIQARGFVVVAFKHSETNFVLQHLFAGIPSNLQIFYQDEMWLSNDGERICLYNKQYKQIDMMSYRHHNATRRKYSYYPIDNNWNLEAHNGTKSTNLKSIQRKNIHFTTSEIQSLQSDYYVDTPTPGRLAEGIELPYLLEFYEVGKINTRFSVGTLAGSADVTPTGAAAYSIPIEVPVGTNGFQPQVSIAYNSQGGYGALGIGWDVAGLSSISRGLQNFYFDQTENGTIDATTIQFNNTDRLYIDGQRLILLEGTHFQSGAVYGTETENYARVKIKTSPETQKIYFELTAKEGNVTEYGKTENSLLKDGNKIMSWRINKAKDVYENEINYTYQNNGQYISQITYNNNKVQFTYQTAEKPQKRCINGFWQKQEYLLSGIFVFVGEERKSAFLYTYDQSENYAKLDAIIPLYSNIDVLSGLFRMNDADLSKLNPTKIEWGKEESKIESTYLRKLQDGNLYQNVTNAYLYSGDIDGDGQPDIIEMWGGNYSFKNHQTLENGTVYVTLSSNGKRLFVTAFDPSIDANEDYTGRHVMSDCNKILVADLDNDGKNELILVRSDAFYVYQINANNTDMTLRSTHYFSCGCNRTRDYMPVLYNGNNDEYIDLVIIPFYRKSPMRSSVDAPNIKIGVFYNHNGTFNYYADITQNEYIEEYHNLQKEYLETQWATPFLGDFDANGKLDVIQMTCEIDKPHTLPNLDYKETDAFGVIEWERVGLFTHKKTSTVLESFSIDVNNDGLTDVLFRECDSKKNYRWSLYTNNGNGGYNTKSVRLHNYSRANSDDERQMAMPVDYNGDGLVDMILADETFDTKKRFQYTTWYCYKNTGGDFVLEYQRNEKQRLSVINPIVTDINGDGVQDLVYAYSENEYRAFTMPAANKCNVVHAITNGLGQTERFTYKYLSDYNQDEAGNPADVRNLKAPMMVVERHTAIDGTSTSYNFQDPKTHIKGRGFLGFQKITAFNSRTKQKTVSEYEINGNYYLCNLKKQTVSIDNTDISETVNTNGIIYTTQIKRGKKGEKRFIAVVGRQTVTDKLRNFTSTTNYDFNMWGVVTKKKTTAGDLTSITEYFDFQKRNRAGLVEYLPGKMKVTNRRTGFPDYVFNSEYTYFESGNVATAKENTGTYVETETAYTYYPKGNLHIVSVSADETTKTTAYKYDLQYRFATEKINVLGQSSYTTYDAFGRKTSETGIDGLTASSTYNALGQLIKKTLPTGEEISYATQWGVSCLYKTIVSSNKLSNVTKTHYDNLGREIYSETTGWNGNLLKSSIEYDPLTLKVKRVVKPHYDGETELYTEYEYSDWLQRVKKETVFDGENTLTTKYTYDDVNGKITVTAPDQMQTYSKKNSLGEVILRHDEGGDITYAYNALGKPVSIAVASGGSPVITAIEYDEAGRQWKLHDPNAGTIEYKYYADGALKKQTNANGDITEFTYDIAGRTHTKTVKDYDNDDNTLLLSTTETKYNYIENGNGVGQISSIKLKENGNIIHSQVFTYNERHLLATATDNYHVDNKAFTFSYTYDDLWRLKTTSSPGGLVTENVYDVNYGDLYQIKKGTTVIWQGTAQNSNGQFTQFTLGNGIVTENTCNPRGELTDILARKGNNVPIQNAHYEYSAQTGNLLVRNDIVNGIFESFEYDNLDRLKTATLNNNLLFDIDYGDNGNIYYKDDVGSYVYDHPEKPNAMTGVEGPNGGGIDTNTKQIIEYTPFNKISKVAEFNIAENAFTAEYRIFYGLDQQRIKTEFYQSSILKKTRYYLGSYELDIDENGNEVETDYIFAPTGLVAMVKTPLSIFASTDLVARVKTPLSSWEDLGLGVLYYIHSDRQGSLERITDRNGTLVASYAYSAWGARTLLSGTDITDHGYTGHEHLTALNLINMNGRIYDPVLARFLSPDPFVQAPDFTQSFNRYSYCLNNPLKYTDPSGEFFYIDLGFSWSEQGGLSVSVEVGVGVKGVASAGIYVGHNFKDGSFSFGGSAGCMGAYVSAGYNTASGWYTSTGYGHSIPVGGPFSISVFNASVSYSESGGFSGNVGWINFSKNGIEINPSISASANLYNYDPAAVRAARQARAAAKAASDAACRQIISESLNAAAEAVMAGVIAPDLIAAVNAAYGEHYGGDLREIMVIGRRQNSYFQNALQYEGVPYQLGGMSTEGVDCSGLVNLATGQIRRVWTTSEGNPPGNWKVVQTNTTTYENFTSNLQQGDLLLWTARHTAFYAGEGNLFHAHGAAGTPTGYTGDFRSWWIPNRGYPIVYRQIGR